MASLQRMDSGVSARSDDGDANGSGQYAAPDSPVPQKAAAPVPCTLLPFPVLTCLEGGTTESMNTAARRLFGIGGGDEGGIDLQALLGRGVDELERAQAAPGAEPEALGAPVDVPGVPLRVPLPGGRRPLFWASVSIDVGLDGMRYVVVLLPLLAGGTRLLAQAAREEEEEAAGAGTSEEGAARGGGGGDALRRVAADPAAAAVLNASVDPMIVINADGEVQIFNEASTRLLGWAADEIIGVNVSILMPPPLAQRHDSFIARYLETGRGELVDGPGREVMAKHKNGSMIPVRLTVSACRVGEELFFSASMHDMRTLVAREEEARRSSHRLRVALHATAQAIIITSRDGKVELANPAACSLFGYSRERLTRGGVAALWDAASVAPLAPADVLGACLADGRPRTLRGRRSGGRRVPIRIDVSASKTEDDSIVVVTVTDLTEEIRRNAETARTNARLESSLEAMLNPLIIANERGIIQRCNPAACSLFGYDMEELVGANVSMLCDPRVAPHHDEILRRYIRTGEARIIGRARELLAQKKDGTLFPISMSISESYNGDEDTAALGDDGAGGAGAGGAAGERIFVSCIHDLSSAHERQKELLETTSRLKSLMVAMLDPMVVCDTGGVIEMCNPSACRLFGYEMHELVGQNVSVLCDPMIAPHHDGILKRYLMTGERHIIGKPQRRLLARRKDGSLFPIALSVSESDASNDQKRMFIACLHDLSEVRAREVHLKLSNQRLVAAEQRAHEQSQLKGLFLANISHELRTPLNGILATIQLMNMSSDAMDSDTEESVRTIESCSSTLLKLVNEILDLSKIEANKLDLESRRFDVHKVMDDMNRMFRALAREMGVRVRYSVDESVPRYVYGDDSRIKQVLTNLLSNAVKFTRRRHAGAGGAAGGGNAGGDEDEDDEGAATAAAAAAAGVAPSLAAGSGVPMQPSPGTVRGMQRQLRQKFRLNNPGTDSSGADSSGAAGAAAGAARAPRGRDDDESDSDDEEATAAAAAGASLAAPAAQYLQGGTEKLRGSAASASQSGSSNDSGNPVGEVHLRLRVLEPGERPGEPDEAGDDTSSLGGYGLGSEEDAAGDDGGDSDGDADDSVSRSSERRRRRRRGSRAGVEPVEDPNVIRILFTVEDSGVGIPPDRVGAVFDLFEQASASTTRRFGGTGLGLSISRRIVELMNGRIWVESEVGVGSRFSFFIEAGINQAGKVAITKRQTAARDAAAQAEANAKAELEKADASLVNDYSDDRAAYLSEVEDFTYRPNSAPLDARSAFNLGGDAAAAAEQREAAAFGAELDRISTHSGSQYGGNAQRVPSPGSVRSARSLRSTHSGCPMARRPPAMPERQPSVTFSLPGGGGGGGSVHGDSSAPRGSCPFVRVPSDATGAAPRPAPRAPSASSRVSHSQRSRPPTVAAPNSSSGSGISSHLHVPQPAMPPSTVWEATARYDGSPLAHEGGEAPLRLAAADVAQVRVLIVDDNSLNRKMMARCLRALGCQLQDANDGHQAMALIANRNFQVVLTDLHMDGMGGLELAGAVAGEYQERLRRLLGGTRRDRAKPRAAEHAARPAVIGVTADALVETRNECLDAGMDYVITKPISVQLVRDAVHHFAVLNMRERESLAAAVAKR